MPLFTDHLNRQVDIPQPPERIISLCPSQTETLFALGLGSRIAGRTRFCIHPSPQVDSVLRVGGTKEVKMDRIATLDPDLIICEKEENTKEMVEALSQNWPVYVTDVRSPADSLRMVRDLGAITGRMAAGEALATELDTVLQRMPGIGRGRKCLYFIWRDPWMVAGPDTFIHSILELCQFENVVPAGMGRYPEVDAEWIKNCGAELILLSSEPYPFSGENVQELTEMTGNAWVELVDGEMFSWYGVRMLQAPYYFARWES